MSDPKMMTVTDASGASKEVADNPENRELAKTNGMQIQDPGLLSQAFDFAKGISQGGAATRIAGAVADKVLDRPTSSPNLPDHTGKMIVVDQSGQRQEVNDNEDNRAMAQAHGMSIENSQDTQAHDMANLPENQGAEGAGRTFVQKAQSEFGFGIPEMIDKALMSPVAKKAYELRNEEHSTASALGTGAGIAGSLALPMGEGEVAAKAQSLGTKALAKIGIDAGSMGGRVAVGALKGAATGALYSAPHAAGQAVFEDDSKAGEAMGWGIGIGTLLGGAGPLAGKFIDVVRPYAAQKAEEATAMRLMKNLGAERGTIKKLGGSEEAVSIGKELLDAGLVKGPMSQEKLLEAVDHLGETSGKKVGEVLDTLDGHLAADAKAHSDMLDARRAEALSGKTPLSYDAFAAPPKPALEGMGFSPANLIKGIQEEVVADKVGPYFTKDMRMARDAMQQIISSVEGKAPKVKGSLEEQIAALGLHAESMPTTSFAKGQELKSLFKPDFQKNPLTLNERDLLDRQLYKLVTGELNDAADRTVSKLEESGIATPGLIDDYNRAKRQYRAVMQTQQMRQNLLAKEDGNRYFSPSDYGFAHFGEQLGLGHAMTHGGSVVGGGLGGIVAGYAAKRVGESTPFQTALIAAGDRASKALRSLAAVEVKNGVSNFIDALTKLGARASGAAIDERQPVKPHTVSPISSIMGGTTRDPRKALAELTPVLDGLINNPEKMKGHLQSMASTVANSGDPQAAIPMMQTQVNALQYLHQMMPRDQQIGGQIFYNSLAKPTDAQILDFQERCAAASDPFYLTHKVLDGTLSQTHLETVARVYPQLYSLIQDQAKQAGLEHMLDGSKPAGYGARAPLQALTGMSTDPLSTPQNIAMLQSGYAKGGLAGASPAPPRHHGGGKPMKSIGGVASWSDKKS